MDRLSSILTLAGANLTEVSSGDCENVQLVETIRAQKPELLGSNDLEAVEIVQWLIASQQTLTVDAVEKLEIILSQKSFLVGQKLTLADLAVAWQLSQQVSLMQAKIQVSRWYRQITHAIPGISALPASASSPIMFSLPIFEKSEPKKEVKDDKVVEPKKEDSKSSKDEQKKDDTKKDSKPAKSETVAAAPSDVSAPSDDLDPSKLEIRVGMVVKCWNHEGSDKLLCEEIDLGEGTNRQIASGIRLHYSADQVQGRKVLVLANLKERSIAGFKSQGMVLCASNADHTVVKLLDPPASAKIGDKVLFTGFSGESATPAHMAKKKIFESLSPFLRTDGQGVAHWKTAPFTIDGQQCVAPLPDAIVA